MTQTATTPTDQGASPALCRQCRHRRDADRASARVAPSGALSPESAETLNKLRQELRTHLELEDVAFRSRVSARLTRRPMAHDWCAAKSAVPDGTYFFTAWQTAPTCPAFQCLEALDGCQRCASGNGSCARGRNESDGHSALASGVQAPTRSASAEPVASAATEVPLGRSFQLRPVTRPLDLGTGSFQVDYELVDAALAPKIEGRGLTQTYLIFGGPGAGKTHYFKYLLTRLLAHPDRPGCLLLDPKGVLTGWLADTLASMGRADDLVVLAAGTAEHAFNVLGDDLPPKELGRLLTEVVVAGAAGIDEGWQVLIGDLLESAAVLIHADPGEPGNGGVVTKPVLTVATLLNDVLYRARYRYPDGSEQLEYPIVVRAVRVGATHPDVDVRIAADRIADYFASTEDRQRRFVRQIIERTLAEMVSPDWQYLSAKGGGSSFYSSIIEHHRVATVAVGQGSPAFQRSLSTLVKALFQQAVLASLSRSPGKRPFFILACDEYAQAVTEGETGLVSDSRFFSLSREAGCLSLLALQSVATGRSRFPASMKDRWDGILGNVTVKFFMRLNDLETAELGSSLAGTQHSFVPVVSTGLSGTGASLTEGVTVLEHRVVPAWYLTNRMPQGYALVHGTLDGVSPPISCFVRAPAPGEA